MRWRSATGGVIPLLLVISVAFNVGFGTMFGVRTYRGRCHLIVGERGVCCLPDELGLSPEQEARMHAAQQRLMQQIENLRRELHVERQQLIALLVAAETDRAAIVVQLERITALQQRIQECVIDHLLEGRKLLEPDQQEAFKEVIRMHISPRCGLRCESAAGHGPQERPCWDTGEGG